MNNRARLTASGTIIIAAYAAALSLGCSILPKGPPPPVPVWVRSHNRSHVDVYLACGDRDPIWLGVAPPDQSVAFEIPARQAECSRGLNFFLVVWEQGRGYWAGPVRPRWGAPIQVVIEKYAGLSTAELRGN
jgi:hypothetical protein